MGKMVLVDAREFEDGGPNDRGWDAGTYWVPEELRPIPWKWKATDAELEASRNRDRALAEWVRKNHDVADAGMLSYTEVKDPEARLDVYRAEIDRLTKLVYGP